MNARRIGFALFLVVFAAELSWGYYVAHIRDYIHGDAISRVANAFYVLYSRDPHLAAIGFIWNPLPSMLEMIPLLFWKVAPIVASSGLAAVIVSASFTAATVVLIYRMLLRHEVPAIFRRIIIAGFIANPFIFFYGANGMSEMMFSFAIVWAVSALTTWMREQKTVSLVEIGVALSLGFWIRYEAVALGFAIAVCIVIILYVRLPIGFNRAEFRQVHYPKMEASLLLALAPPVCSGLLWIFLNATIMGDPLYFLHSGYSNTAFVQDRSTELIEMTGDFIRVTMFAFRKMLFFLLPLAALLVLRMMTARLWQWDTLLLLTLAGAIPAMQALMLYQGSSYGWLRFFMYPLIIAIAWLPYEWTQIRMLPRAKTMFAVICAAVLLSAGVIRDMNDQRLAPEEYGSLHMSESQTARDMKEGREIARYLDALIESRKPEETLILTDSFSAFSVIVNIRNPRNLVITNDRDFPEILDAPQDHGIDYILVSRLEGAVLQVIHHKYPDMFDGGVPWTELTEEFSDNWRLYRVLPKAADE